jgi:hypothetical protein
MKNEAEKIDEPQGNGVLPCVNNCLNTKVLPKYNCSNCANFIHKNLEKLETQTAGWYAVECRNLVHPLQDCILRGFEGHSEQPGFSQTLNK